MLNYLSQCPDSPGSLPCTALLSVCNYSGEAQIQVAINSVCLFQACPGARPVWTQAGVAVMTVPVCVSQHMVVETLLSKPLELVVKIYLLQRIRSIILQVRKDQIILALFCFCFDDSIIPFFWTAETLGVAHHC